MHDIGLFDSETGRSLHAEKIVDVTAHQKHPEKAELLFTTAERGRIVQLRTHNDGIRIHYFLDEDGGRKMMDDDSERFGFERGKLLALADQHAPR